MQETALPGAEAELGDLTRLSTIWGKDPHLPRPYPLLCHLLDSHVTAGAVWDHWLRPGLRALVADVIAAGDHAAARSFVQLAAALHDVGKANPIFQLQSASSRLQPWREVQSAVLGGLGLPSPDPDVAASVRLNFGHAARRHEYIGYKILAGLEPPASRSVGQHWLAHAIAGHHGRWINSGGPDDTLCVAAATSGAWATTQQQVCGVIEHLSGVSVTQLPDVAATDAATAVILVNGLVVLADWLASDQTCVDAGYALLDQGHQSGRDWLGTRRAELTDLARDRLGMYHPIPAPARAILGTYRPRPLQQEAVSHQSRDGLWMVAYPTGEGKTEAAMLRHAGRSDEGLIFALPTRATTDAMQGRLERVFAGTGNNVILSHQMAAARDSHTVGAAHGADWYDTSIRRLVAPVVTATCDQVLSGALTGKHAPLRLLALANHHVVLDEVHTYDHFQSSLLAELLAWWGATNTRVTLLSATLPVWQQRNFRRAYTRDANDVGEAIPYPGHGFVRPPVRDGILPEPGGLARVVGKCSQPQPDLVTRLTETEKPEAAHTAWVADVRAEHPGAHVGVVVNVVDRAVAVAAAVARSAPDADILCLHSRMTAGHRARVEADLHARLGPAADPGRPVVVVGTQILEASLDIDLDLMSSDLAPAPSLVQRAGRLWRFRDGAARAARFGGAAPVDREMHVVVGPPSKSVPYLSPELLRVAAYLGEHPRLGIPDSVQDFVDVTGFDLETASLDVAGAGEEFAEAMKRLEAANRTRSPISTRILGRRAARHEDLRQLTDRDLDEDLMGTRYIDRPSSIYLLLPDTTTIGELLQHKRACFAALSTAIPVSGRYDRALQEAHGASMQAEGLSGWDPASRIIAGMRPVHLPTLREVALTYDPFLGLIGDQQ